MNSIRSGLRVLSAIARYRLGRPGADRRVAVNEDVRAIVAEIRKRSYIVIPDYLPRAECARITQDIDKLIDLYPDCVQVDPVGSDHRIFGSENGSESIMAFHRDQFAVSVGDSDCSRRLANFTTLAARLETRPGNAGSGQGWHRDNLQPQFKAIVYLSDVGPDDGPFQILRGSHRPWRKVLDTIRADLDPDSTRLTEKQVERLLRRKSCSLDTVLGKAGSMILVDVSAIHRGAPIVQGVRYALTNYYYKPEELTGRKEKFSPMLTPERAGTERGKSVSETAI